MATRRHTGTAALTVSATLAPADEVQRPGGSPGGLVGLAPREVSDESGRRQRDAPGGVLQALGRARNQRTELPPKSSG